MKNLWREEGEMSSSLSTMNVRVVGFNVNDVILQLIVAVVKRHRCWSWLVWMTLARTNFPMNFLSKVFISSQRYLILDSSA